MSFDQCWRWFGPADPISLREVQQTGATGVVTALHEVPTGEIWTMDAIMARKQIIETAGLRWAVAESLPVHDEIKRRGPNTQHLIENYQTSIRNLGRCGIRTLCYNFMPVLDWSRTDLQTRFADGSTTTAFHSRVLAAFDLFILKRAGAEKDYDAEQIREAKSYFLSLNEHRREQLVHAILLGFPGSGETYTLDQLRAALGEYRTITEGMFRENLLAFLRQVVPVAEESDVLLALHPDDPPWPVLGLPRVVSTSKDVRDILCAFDSPSNGITLCTGSFGADKRNDLVEMAAQFAHRINFVHLRNVTALGKHEFIESDHLDGDVDMYGVIRALLLEQQRRITEGRPDASIPMRPDHGHLMDADRGDRVYYPGYSLFGRMRGLAELRGLELGIRRSLGL